MDSTEKNKMVELLKRAGMASKELALAETEVKDSALKKIASYLVDNTDFILSENKKDVDKGIENGMSPQLLDRLSLDKKRIESIAEGIYKVISLPDPIGEVIEEFTRPNGLRIKKVRVPMGTIGMIYEARPNVTVDSAVLSLKAGSSVVLRGSSSAISSNAAEVTIIRKAIEDSGLPADCVTLIDDPSRETVDEMMKMRGLIDLLIPRGGGGLISKVVNGSLVPVLETGVGNCHIYIDREAKDDICIPVVINAKTQRPSVCNAAETLLVHRDRKDLLVKICGALRDAGVTLHGCDRTREVLDYVIPANEEDYMYEYLSLDMAVKVVDSIDEAISHIAEYGSGHTEAILTENRENAVKFERMVDAACVNVNASTRFTDGFEFGLGAEIGISTQKMHARGPLGLREITSYKYIVEGNGQIRK